MMLRAQLERVTQQAEILRKHEVSLQRIASYAFREYRERNELSTTSLAVKLAVTTAYVENVEAEYLMPSEDVCRRLVALAEESGVKL